jgi:hypothetical protein
VAPCVNRLSLHRLEPLQHGPEEASGRMTLGQISSLVRPQHSGAASVERDELTSGGVALGVAVWLRMATAHAAR